MGEERNRGEKIFGIFGRDGRVEKALQEVLADLKRKWRRPQKRTEVAPHKAICQRKSTVYGRLVDFSGDFNITSNSNS